MRYLYGFINATLVMRVIDHLRNHISRYVKTVTVVYLPERWIINVELFKVIGARRAGDCKAFLGENGTGSAPLAAMELALQALSTGQTPTAVMNRYHVVIVSHGAPNSQELKVFCQQYSQGLGYCPPSLV